MKRIFACSEDDPEGDIYRVYAAIRDGCAAADIPPRGEQRTRAKVPVLSLSYLAGPGAVIRKAREYGLCCDEPKARAIIEEYYRIFPGIRRWHNKARLRADQGMIKEGRSILGRRRLILARLLGELEHKYRYRVAQAEVNYIIQSSCADGQKLSLVRADRRLDREGLEVVFIHSIHDELLALCRRDHVTEACRIIEEEVKEAYKLAIKSGDVPIVFKMQVVERWSDKE